MTEILWAGNTLLAAGDSNAVKDIINVICRPHWFFVISCVGVAAFLVGYRRFTRPGFALFALFAFTAFYVLSGLDSDFRSIIVKADNVPITMMMYLVGLCLWMAFRQAAINDTNMEAGRPLIEAGSDNKVLVWPDLVYIELIALVICMVLLTVWTVVLRAPLEQPADPSVAPNPAKAPWYFLGLQELLVYFDPWIAGVLLPGLIVLGLMAIPYIDKNPRGNGYYTFKERPFAISMFVFGFVILWVVLIVFGTFLRGPNWNFFGPYEYWDPHRPAALLNINLAEIFWVQWLGRGLPTAGWAFLPHFIVREAPGIVLMLFYFLVLPGILRYTVFRKLGNQMGFVRYAVMAQLFLWMALVPIKMALRWTMNFKYFVAITEWFLNV